MTSKEQKKQQKQKAREKVKKKKILARREELRAPAREERKFLKHQKRIDKLQKEMGDLSVWSNEVMQQMPEKVLAQLEHNAKILKELELEHQANQRAKLKINQDLEDQGHFSMKEKMDFLSQQLIAQQKAENEIAEVGVIKANKDIAEVEVVKDDSEK